MARVLEVGEYVTDFCAGRASSSTSNHTRLAGKKHSGAQILACISTISGHQLGRTQPGVFSERFLIPDADTTLAKIPEGVSLEQALMCVDVVTTGFTGAQNADIEIW